MRRGALVLCGGGSRRMGRDKATLPFGPEVLLQRVVRLVVPAVDEVVVVAGREQALPPLPASVRVARDEAPDRGPLEGLLAGLEATRAEVAYATGCDVPFLRRAVVDLLFARQGSHAVAVARAQGFLHPLCAVYRRDVRSAIRRLLGEGRLRPVALYEHVPTIEVGEDELRAVDPDLETLAACNTPEAYEAALAKRDARETS